MRLTKNGKQKKYGLLQVLAFGFASQGYHSVALRVT
jgi:hypothetical protein